MPRFDPVPMSPPKSRPGRVRVRLLAAVLAMLVVSSEVGAETTAAPPNEVARVLAGLPVAEGSPGAALARQPAWQRHARAMNRAWADLERRQLAAVKAWSARELPAPRPTLLYTFSGPDFVYAHAFFPEATTYVLAGLEAVGELPVMPGAAGHGKRHARGLERRLGGVRNAIATLVDFGFFKTKRMRSELTEGDVGGTLPVLYVFLARTGHTLRSVELVDLDGTGKVTAASGRKAEGVRIVFAGEDGKVRTLYYFRTDLSDRGIAVSGFLAFAETLGPRDALLKSASYLMHSGGFSRVRDYLLASSDRIVQDDSGIPLAALPPAVWQRRPFGRYKGPIPLFSTRYQRDLAELYRKGKAPALAFGIGYRHRRGESSLLVADRTVPLAARPQAPAAEPQSPPPAKGAPAGAASPPPLPGSEGRR
jgi:hypothetical protein